MERRSETDLILADFLKYVPEIKRKDFELILMRCNFNDPADPMFSVLLFLLFMQDNLVDNMEELSERIKVLPSHNSIITTTKEKPSTKTFIWKFVITTLLALQLILSGFCLWKLFSYSQNQHYYQPQTSSRAIQKMNSYWDIKIENAKKERSNMNFTEIMSNDVMRIVIPATIILGFLVLVQIILMGIVITELIYRDEQFKKVTDNLIKELHELPNSWKWEHLLHQSPVKEVHEEITASEK